MKCLIEVLQICSQHQNLQYRYLLSVKGVLTNSTQRISSDVSEVFVLSALEMLAAPQAPIWLPVVCERCLNKTTHSKYQVM